MPFITFLDDTGVNPLPQGIFVTLTLQPSGIFFGDGFLLPGGVLPLNVTYGLTYTASFFGAGAPTVPITFTAGPSEFLQTGGGLNIQTQSGQNILVSGGPQLVPNYATPNAIFFFDETGINPMPAGLFVTIFSAPNPPGQPNWAVVGTGYTGLSGIFNKIALVPGQLYGATFIGVQAPAGTTAHFQANANPALSTIAIADNYRSPCLSQTGYTQQEMNLWPRGWFGQSATSPGGNAYALAWAEAGVLALLDVETQYILSCVRLLTSVGADIDSWALDIFGMTFERCSGWSDALWIQNIQAIFAAKKPTQAGMQAILNIYASCYLALSTQKMSLDYQGAMDTYGFTDYVPGYGLPTANIGLGLDTFGGLDTTQTFLDVPVTGLAYQTPNIIVFDAQTNPTLAGTILPNIVPPNFCVYFQYTAYSDSYIAPIAPFVPQLVALVNACKALGTIPVYAANLP